MSSLFMPSVVDSKEACSARMLPYLDGVHRHVDIEASIFGYPPSRRGVLLIVS